MPDLKGKVIIVTGASSGIGKEAALECGRQSATVILCARRMDRLQSVAVQIQESGGIGHPVELDVGDETQVQSMIELSVKNFGKIDVLINNAGIGLYSPVPESNNEQMMRLLRTNFLGTFYCIRHTVPVMKQQGYGHIITVSSMAGKRGTPLSGAYCATKFAQVGLMDSLRRELQGSGIRTTVVLPGATETDFFVNLENPSKRPVQRYGPVQQASEVARAIVKAIHHPRAEVITQRFGRALIILNAISPRFLDWVLQKTYRRPH